MTRTRRAGVAPSLEEQSRTHAQRPTDGITHCHVAAPENFCETFWPPEAPQDHQEAESGAQDGSATPTDGLLPWLLAVADYARQQP